MKMDKIHILSVILCLSMQWTTGEYIPPGPKYKCPIINQIWPCICHSPSDDGISLRCEDVSLATLAAALVYPTISGIPVQHLHLVQLNTEKLYGSLIEGLNVTSITIQDSPIAKLHSDILYPARSTLKSLYLLNTKLTEFPDDALQELEVLETLTIDKHLISSLKDSINGLGNLKNIRISNGNITEISKQTFSGLNRLIRLDLHGNEMTTIPKDAFANLKNVEFFDISHNRFTKLDPNYVVHLTKMTWFNASHNAITEFNRGAFVRSAYLRVIVLTHNQITKLDAAAFRGMRLLVRLFLNDNKISDIGRGAFGSLPNIASIDLARNRLKFLDFQLFSKLRFAEYINVAENEITRVKSGAFQELQYLVINMSRNAISMIEKDSFTTCVNITILDMSHNLIDNFTRGAFDEFSYPNEWLLSHNKLKSAGDIPLKHMTGIKILNVSHNEINEIPKATFPKLYEMHTIDFSRNNISKIFPAIFGNLFGIRYLNLSHNNMTEIGASVFGAIPTIIELNLDHNRLKAVSSAAFTRLASLRELTIKHNKLKKVFQIPPSLNELNISHNEISSLSKAWPTMNALLRLDLSDNELGGNLEKGSFSNLATLQKVVLSGNNITEIPTEALSDLTTVQYIDLSRNSIQSLPKAALGRLPVVFDLLLSQNIISEIASKAFEGLLQLLHLDLSQNQLKEVTVGALSGLVSLRKVNFSRNSLTRTDNGTNCLFEENLSLETIDLSWNQFSSINPNTFPEQRWTNYKVAEIDLSHNGLTFVTKDFLRGTKRLKRLNLSHNKLTEIRPMILGNITTLEYLDLSHNHLSLVTQEILGPPPNMTELNLSRNLVRKFPTEILSKAPFKLIDLERNRLRHFDVDFLPKIRNGSQIILKDNPLACDCRLIFLKRYIADFRFNLANYTREYLDELLDFRCGPGTLLLKLSESDLECNSPEDLQAPVIPANYDVDIRTFTQKGANVELKWRVRSKMDITSFRLTLVDSSSSGVEIFQQTFPYNVRSAKIVLLPGTDQLCLTPSLSRSDVRAPKICHKLNENVSSSAIRNAWQSWQSMLMILTLATFRF